MSKKELQDKLMRKFYMYAALILLFFGLTAIVGSVIGNFIDRTYSVKPWGTIGVMIISYVVSWLIAKPLSVKVTNLINKKDVQRSR